MYNIKYAIALVIGVSLFPTEVFGQESNETVKVTVYYESLCPYCKEFVVSQLYPGFKKLSSYIQLDLVPYGNAEQNKTNGSWEFDCQHGPSECYGNKIQACGLFENKKQEQTLEFVNCLMNQSEPASDESVVKCSSKLDVPSDSILSCAKGIKGDEQLAQYGERTIAIRKLIQGVPSVFFNDQFKLRFNELAVEHFFTAACVVLQNKPTICTTDDDNLASGVQSPIIEAHNKN